MEGGGWGKKEERAGQTGAAGSAFPGQPAGKKPREQKKSQLFDIHILA
jgi:hypothetical protein